MEISNNNKIIWYYPYAFESEMKFILPIFLMTEKILPIIRTNSKKDNDSLQYCIDCHLNNLKFIRESFRRCEEDEVVAQNLQKRAATCRIECKNLITTTEIYLESVGGKQLIEESLKPLQMDLFQNHTNTKKRPLKTKKTY